MKRFFAYLLGFFAASTAAARLGDTLDQLEARYGLEKSTGVPAGQMPLLEGGQQFTFEFAGCRIVCSLLTASDGQSYVYREQYTKKQPSGALHAGKWSPIIGVSDRQFVFAEEAGLESWNAVEDESLFMPLGARAWVRSDCAVACISASGKAFFLSLPQSLKYEAELKAIKERLALTASEKAVGAVPDRERRGFNGPPMAVPLLPTLVSAVADPAAPQNDSNPRLALEKLLETAAAYDLADPGERRVVPRGLRPGDAWTVGVSVLMGIAALVVAYVISKLIMSSSFGGSRSGFRGSKAPGVSGQSAGPRTSGARLLGDLTWDEVELLVAELYRREGFTAELSAGMSVDGRSYLVLTRGFERVLLQCSHWGLERVTTQEIEEFCSALTSDGGQRGIFVTSGSYTEEARQFADGKPVKLIDAQELGRRVQAATVETGPDLLDVRMWAAGFLKSSKVTIPRCPLCKGMMVLRLGGSGKIWGCLDSPRCRGKRDLRPLTDGCALVKE